MRRRRKTKYTWLPIQNGGSFGEGDADASWQNFALDVPPSGGIITGVIPVVADLPQGTLTTVENEGIGEIIGNEYLLKRIVGKVFAGLTIQLGENPVQAQVLMQLGVIVTAGWFVARADPQNLGQPISATEGSDIYGPGVASLTRQPWVWRRTWQLGAGAFGPGWTEDQGVPIPANSLLPSSAVYPVSNIFYGSVADGPHVDAKTGRRVRLDERLWFAASAATWTPGGYNVDNFSVSVNMTIDCRYLGALRRPRGRSNFA